MHDDAMTERGAWRTQASRGVCPCMCVSGVPLSPVVSSNSTTVEDTPTHCCCSRSYFQQKDMSDAAVAAPAPVPTTEKAQTEEVHHDTEEHQDKEQHDKEKKKAGLWKQFKEGAYNLGDKMEHAVHPLEEKVNKATANANHSILDKDRKEKEPKEKEKEEKHKKDKHHKDEAPAADQAAAPTAVTAPAAITAPAAEPVPQSVAAPVAETAAAEPVAAPAPVAETAAAEPVSAPAPVVAEAAAPAAETAAAAEGPAQ